MRKRPAASSTSLAAPGDAAPVKSPFCGPQTEKKGLAAVAIGSKQQLPEQAPLDEEEVQIKRRRLSGKQPWPPRPKDPDRTAFFPSLPIDVSVDAPLQRVLYIMRGPPGCGKSTAARKMLLTHLRCAGILGDRVALGSTPDQTPFHRAFILSTDDYFTAITAEGSSQYDFVPSALSANHKQNQVRCEVSMKLGMTPLFVDNTNICLWEMRAYVELAETHHYKVRIVDPRLLSSGAFQHDILQERTREDRPGRVQGKVFPPSTLERMVSNFEDLPGGWDLEAAKRAACTEASREALDAILSAKAPWELKAPRPLYSGLDVEAKALALLGGLELPSTFWPAEADVAGAEVEKSSKPGPSLSYYFDVRYDQQSRWTLPDRLHVTVRFFGRGQANPDLMAAAKDLVGTWHEVEVTGIVFVVGGGLLCAICELPGLDSEVEYLAPEIDWRPHITLATASPWRAVDSTAVILALEEARANLAATALAAKAGAATKQAQTDGKEEDSSGPAMTNAEQDAAPLPLARVEAAAEEKGKDLDGEAAEVGSTQLEESQLLEQTQPESPVEAQKLGVAEAEGVRGAEAAVGAEASASKPPDSSHPADAAQPPSPSKSSLGSHKEVYRDVLLLGRKVDICAWQYAKPLQLGPCQFKSFFR